MRYLIKFSYDGTNYAGFQKQPNENTIEKCLETAATKINNNQKTTITATGRTDKHVHAKCQYAHLDITVNITPPKLKRALNSNLPEDIYIIEAHLVKEDFHARYNVVEKTYKYYINLGEYNPLERNYVYQYNYKLNIEAMKEGIKYLIGTHDYRAFVTESKDIENCTTGFMRYQVRNMVGLLIRIGENKKQPIEVKKILESKSRKKNGYTAKAEGLYLEDVKYKNLEKNIIKL